MTEHLAEWLIPVFLANPIAAKVAGQAARDFLRREEQSHGTSSETLLTFLALVFGGMPETEVALQPITTLDDELAAAIIARFPKLAEQIHRQDRSALLFVPYPKRTDKPSLDGILEATRDMAVASSDALSFLETVLLFGGLSPTESERLASSSKLGALAGAVLEHAHHRVVRARWLVRALGIGIRYEANKESQLKQIRETLKAQLLDKPEFEAEYIGVLQDDLAHDVSPDRGLLPEPELLLHELLEIRKELTLDQWQRVLQSLIASPYLLNLEFARQIVAVIVGESQTESTFLLEPLHRLGEALDASEPRFSSIDDGLLLLIVGLALLFLEDSATPLAQRLFLLGLADLLLHDESTHMAPSRPFRPVRAIQVMSALNPLWEVVPREHIATCFQNGLASDLPEVRSCCRLLASLVQITAPMQSVSAVYPNSRDRLG